MTRIEATRLIVDLAGDSPIVASLGHPAYDLFAAGDRPQNFYTWGSMGLASSVGLGLALARPDVRVFVLDGDGSLLMNLGSLATIGLLRPANLVVIVMDNEEYATTGGQATPTAHGADLAAAALAMGIMSTATVRSDTELRAVLSGGHSEGGRESIAFISTEESTGSTGRGTQKTQSTPDPSGSSPGPLFVGAKVTESAPTAKPPLDCVFIKQRFMRAIRNPESATAGDRL